MATSPKVILSKGKITPHFSYDELIVNQYETITLTQEEWDAIELEAQMMEEFRTKLKNSPLTVNAWLRGPEYNKKKGGISSSNHLRGKAMDIKKQGISKSNFIQYAKIWRDICKKHGVVGEAGRYTWGVHLGYQTYSKTFYHWDSTSGKQINMPYSELK